MAVACEPRWQARGVLLSNDFRALRDLRDLRALRGYSSFVLHECRCAQSERPSVSIVICPSRSVRSTVAPIVSRRLQDLGRGVTEAIAAAAADDAQSAAARRRAAPAEVDVRLPWCATFRMRTRAGVSSGSDRALDVGADVAGQQHRHVAVDDLDDHRVVVAHAPAFPVGRGRMEHAQPARRRRGVTALPAVASTPIRRTCADVDQRLGRQHAAARGCLPRAARGLKSSSIAARAADMIGIAVRHAAARRAIGRRAPTAPARGPAGRCRGRRRRVRRRCRSSIARRAGSRAASTRLARHRTPSVERWLVAPRGGRARLARSTPLTMAIKSAGADRRGAQCGHARGRRPRRQGQRSRRRRDIAPGGGTRAASHGAAVTSCALETSVTAAVCAAHAEGEASIGRAVGRRRRSARRPARRPSPARPAGSGPARRWSRARTPTPTPAAARSRQPATRCSVATIHDEHLASAAAAPRHAARLRAAPPSRRTSEQSRDRGSSSGSDDRGSTAAATAPPATRACDDRSPAQRSRRRPSASPARPRSGGDDHRVGDEHHDRQQRSAAGRGCRRARAGHTRRPRRSRCCRPRWQ